MTPLQPHARPPSAPAGSIARIGYLAADTLIGWLPTVSRARARATLVILERGWDDLAVDPRRYRLSAGARLVRLGGKVLPRPDLTFLLEAPAEEIHARKPELEVAEIDRQLAAWRELAKAEPVRFASVSSPTPEDALTVAVEAIEDRLAEPTRGSRQVRHGTLVSGTAERIGRALFRGFGSRSSQVDRSASSWGSRTCRLEAVPSGNVRDTALAREGWNLRHEPVSRAKTELALDTSDGLGPEIAAALGLDDVELAAMLSTDTHRRSRAVLSVMHRGRPVAMVKVAPQGSPELATELRMLYALESSPLRSIVTPRALASFPWRGLDVVAMTVLSHRGRTSRALGPVETDALVELYESSDRLKAALGRPADGGVIAHGDFCGWNTSVLRNGKLAIWDWEWAHVGEPLEDWFHWETQRLVAFGALSIERLVRQTLVPSPTLHDLCERLGLEAASAVPTALRASLRHSITRMSSSGGRELEVRTRMLKLLGGLP